jgi:hypothetical protein
MRLEIARLANISWLQVPDLWASILRMNVSTRTGSQTRSQAASASASAADALPLPELDWPPKLFDDEAACQ